MEFCILRHIFLSDAVVFFEECFIIADGRELKFYSIKSKSGIYSIPYDRGFSVEEEILNAEGIAENAEIEDALLGYLKYFNPELLH